MIDFDNPQNWPWILLALKVASFAVIAFVFWLAGVPVWAIVLALVAKEAWTLWRRR